MATWSRSVRITETVSFSVPTGPYGAAWNQVQQAIDAAIGELQKTLDNGSVPSDDAIRVHAGDDAVVVSFERPHGNCMLMQSEPSS